jgi:phage baseplate assembly protein W
MAFRNPTTSRSPVTPTWYGPILSKNTYLGNPLTEINPNAKPDITTPAPIFPSPISYQAVITSSINMLFGTRPGERLWNPTYGLNMDALVFESLDVEMTQSAELAIRNAITQWEPRVNVLQVSVITNQDNNQVFFKLVLQLAGAPPDDIWTYSVSAISPV